MVGVNIDDICTDITHCLTSLDFFHNRNIRLSALKSSVSLFTAWMKEVRSILNIKAEDMIPTIRYPRILGVTFDNLLYFAAHATDIDTKVRRRNKVLKVLAGTTFGMDKGTIVTSYKGIRCGTNIDIIPE